MDDGGGAGRPRRVGQRLRVQRAAGHRLLLVHRRPLRLPLAQRADARCARPRGAAGRLPGRWGSAAACRGRSERGRCRVRSYVRRFLLLVFSQRVRADAEGRIWQSVTCHIVLLGMSVGCILCEITQITSVNCYTVGDIMHNLINVLN